MKYKKYKIIGFFLAVGFLATSCTSFLDEENNTNLTLENADADTFSQLVNSTYQRARETTTHYAPDEYYMLEDLGTDIVTRGSAISGTDPINDYVKFNSLNKVIQDYWTNQYSIISSANIVIGLAEGKTIKDLADADAAVGVGQVKFFRAMSYFKLVENFGGVPVILKQATTDKRNFPRASEKDVYTQIVADLKDALSKVDEKPSDFGRVSKDAVRQFLSRVLLTRGYKPFAEANDFTDAATYADKVISNHPLVPTFKKLVSIDNQRNSEVVFSYLFGNNATSRGWGNSRHMMYKFRFFDYPGLLRSVKGLGPMPTNFYYSLFEDDDQRAEATFARTMYATDTTTVTIKSTGVKVLLKVGDTAMYFPKKSWTQAKIDAVPYRVVNPDEHYTNDGITSVHYPQFIKFEDPTITFTQPDQPSLGERDMVVMRSGEAYLIAAEAYLKASNSGTAAARLTTLRTRAGLTIPVTSGEVTLDFILDERARELTGEANRWMDLKRTGKLIERTLLHNPHVKLNRALNAKNLLRPIPQNEINNSEGSITQNPM